MRVHRDAACGGQWAACGGCSFAGDLAQLAAAALRVSIAEAALELELAGRGEAQELVAEHERLCLRPRRQAEEFWQACQRRLRRGESSELRQLLRRLLGASHPPGGWERLGGGGPLGASARKTLEHFFCSRTEGRLAFSKQHAELLVAPFHDLPGRLSGFLLVAAAESAPWELVFRRSPEFAAKGLADPGLGLLWASQLPPAEPFGTALFITHDVEAALRLHLAQLRRGSPPLPLLLARHEPTAAWDWLAPENLVCWSSDRAAACGLARRAGGRASLASLPREGLRQSLQRHGPVEPLRSALRRARPWDAALQKLLANEPASRLEESLCEAGLSGEELRDFARGCPASLRSRIEALQTGLLSGKSVDLGRRQLREQGDQWLWESGSLICDAAIRVERLLHSQAGRVFAQGVVRFHGKSYDFTEPAGLLEPGLFEWAAGFLARRGDGPLRHAPGWGRRAWLTALRLSPPAVIRGADRPGWDEERGQFNLRGYALRLGGECDARAASVLDPAALGELPPPEPLSRMTLEAIGTRNEETRIFWAALACLAHNLLAPALRHPPRGILLRGHAGRSAGAAAARLLGCPQRGPLRRDKQLPQLASPGWTSLLGEASKALPLLAQALALPQAAWLAVPAGDVLSRVLEIRGTWSVVRSPQRLGHALQTIGEGAARALPLYLQDLCRRNLRLEHAQEHVLLSVLEDLASWFAREGGPPQAVREARRALLPAGSRPAAEAFAELLFALQARRQLQVLREGFGEAREGAATATYLRETPVVWIPLPPLAAAAERAAGIPMDRLLVERSLVEEQALVKEGRCDGQPGWFVDTSWLDAQAARWSYEEQQ